jgi:peptidoglycan/xylan/chitin deacetylase (PgdA/CDA1 family)
VPEAVLVKSLWRSSTSGVRSATKSALLSTGHYKRRLLGQDFLGVAVLSYHGIIESENCDVPVSVPSLHPPAAEFDAHCRFIREACNPISLSQWHEAVTGGTPLPPRPVLLTFDDGYRSLLTVALPILSKYKIPAVAFVATDAVERAELLWFDAVYRTQGEMAVEAMKHLPYDEWLIRARASATPARPDDPNAPLSVAEVRLLSDDGLVEIGAHSMSHPILHRADHAVQLEEICGSREKLESWTCRTVRAFAYPNGDFTSETIELVSQAGYCCAFTTVERFAPRDSLSFTIPRFMVLNEVGAAELAHRLAYSWPREISLRDPAVVSQLKAWSVAGPSLS